jgi:hypothetical protein
MKNKIAVAFGKMRWKGKSKKEKSEHTKMMARKRWDKTK